MKHRSLVAAIIMMVASLVQASASQAQDVTALFPTALEMSDGSPAQGPWYHFDILEEGTQTATDIAAWLGGENAASQLTS